MIPNLSLRQLAYFVAVADTGSMTAAAHAEQVSQATISVALSDLERRLGVQLMVRKPGHGVFLTEAGVDLVADARQIIAATHELWNRAKTPTTDLRGSLSIGFYTTLAPLYVPALYTHFSHAHPGVELSIIEGEQDQLRRALASGGCELIVTYDSGLAPGLSTRLLRTLHPYVLLAAAHPLADRDSIELHELADEPLILYSAGPSQTNSEQVLRQSGVMPRVIHTSPDIEVVRSLVGRGLGYAILVQHWPVNVTLEGLPVVCVDILDKPVEHRVLAAWPSADALSRGAIAALEYLETQPGPKRNGKRAEP